MEEDMEIAEVFVVHEVDLDYECEAPRFFDFTREETPAEARAVELWFGSGKGNPPSPFAVKLLLGGHIPLKNVHVSPKSKERNARLLGSECDTTLDEDQAIQAKGRGSRFQDQFFSNKMKMKADKAKPRSSTLMKPTASVLAKGNQPSQVTTSRMQTRSGQVDQRTAVTSGIESQAAKRQKLEGGCIFKAVEVKQPINLVHKAPRKDGFDKASHAKLRITIPREPDLETAQRAQRMRPKHNSQMEDITVPVRIFKARPLNRKILEAPQLPLPPKSTPRLPDFQLFHLKTTERAMQHSASVVSSSSAQFNDGSRFLFKADLLNRRKVLVSKGDIGRRIQPIPPTELFSKLSLSSELQTSNRLKGSKENMFNSQQKLQPDLNPK